MSASRSRAGAAGRGSGQALVEFALVAPIVVLLLVAAVDIGRGVFAYNSVTNAAREGARLAIVNQDVASIVLRATQQTTLAETDGPSVSVEFRKATPNADPTANAVCSTISIRCVAIVRFETTYRPITPIVANLVFPGGVTLTATAIEPVEFTCPNSTTSAAACPRQP